MNNKIQFLEYNGRIIARLGNIEGSGNTKNEAKKELKRWVEIMGNIKWVDAITGQEVK